MDTDEKSKKSPETAPKDSAHAQTCIPISCQPGGGCDPDAICAPTFCSPNDFCWPLMGCWSDWQQN